MKAPLFLLLALLLLVHPAPARAEGGLHGGGNDDKLATEAEDCRRDPLESYESRQTNPFQDGNRPDRQSVTKWECRPMDQ